MRGMCLCLCFDLRFLCELSFAGRKQMSCVEHWRRMKISHVRPQRADVLYHAMVLLANKDVKIEDVMQVLWQRFSQSGVEEKRGRISQG